MQLWIAFANSGAFVIYNHAVKFCAVSANKLAIIGCILPSGGFASA